MAPTGRWRAFSASPWALSEVDSQVELAVRFGLVREQPELLAAVGRLPARIKTLHERFDE